MAVALVLAVARLCLPLTLRSVVAVRAPSRTTTLDEQRRIAEILERPVRDAVLAVVEAAADAHDAHGQPVQRGAVADELVRPQRRERGDGVDEGDHAAVGQARRHAEHVLLGHAGVDEAVREAIGETLDDGALMRIEPTPAQ